MPGAVLSDGALRDTYRRTCRVSTWLVAAVTAVDSVALAALGLPLWRYPAALSLLAVVMQWGMVVRLSAEAFVGLLVLVLLALSATAGVLTLELGVEPGFHMPLYAVVLLIAVASRLGPLFKLVMALGFGAALQLLELQAKGVDSHAVLGESVSHAFRSFNLAVLCLTSFGIALSYQLLAQRQQQALLALAETDTLTGLPNRRALNHAVSLLLAQRERHAMVIAVVLADLDHFKSINDRAGHEAGDAVLREASRRLQGALRRGDLLARWGGEEFVAVLPFTGLAGAESLAQRMREAIEASQVQIGHLPVAVTATFGVTEMGFGEPLEEALNRADQALYRGKREGRNRVVAQASGQSTGQSS